MKHRLAAVGLSYFAGLICASYLSDDISFLAGGGCAALGVILLIFKKRSQGIIFIFFSVGITHLALYTTLIYRPVTDMSGQTIELSGTVTDTVSYFGDMASYEIKTEIAGRRAVVALYGPDVSCGYGDKIQFTALLLPVEDNAGFQMKSYYKSKGIFLRAVAKSDIIAEKGDPSLIGAIYGYSDYIGECISRYLPGEEGGLIKAVFLGDKSGLSNKLEENMRRSGISHFAAVSGQHLSVIANIIMAMLELTPLKRRRKGRFLVLSLIIAMFMIFFRLSPSVIRSGIMLILFYAGEPLMRKSSTADSIAAAALIILIPQPYACLDSGFLLSVAGAFGIGVMAPFFCKRIKRMGKALEPLVSSFCACTAVLPVSVLLYGGVSVMGIITGILLQLLFIPLLLFMTLFALLGGNGDGLIFLSGLCAKGIICAVDFTGGLKYSFIPLDYQFVPFICAVSVAFVIAVRIILKKSDRTAMALAISVCVLSAAVFSYRYLYSDATVIRFYSDGSGMCLLAKGTGWSMAIALDDSEKIVTAIEKFRQDYFIDSFSFVYLIHSGSNNISNMKKISSGLFIADGEKTAVKVGEEASLCIQENGAVLKTQGLEISMSDIDKPIPADIMAIHGYKKEAPELSAALVLFSDKRIDSQGIDLYYTDVCFMIKDGKIYSIKGNVLS